jgi:hypothetical protein
MFSKSKNGISWKHKLKRVANSSRTAAIETARPVIPLNPIENQQTINYILAIRSSRERIH